jgi:hypothetical protein
MCVGGCLIYMIDIFHVQLLLRQKMDLYIGMYVCMYVQLGVAIGFLLPSMLVRNHDNLDDIGQDLSVMYYSVAGFTTVLLVLILLCE